jgi:hypothetical protein
MSTQTNDAILFKELPSAETAKPYILYYRTGNNPHPQFFIFFIPHPTSGKSSSESSAIVN